jgi:HAMP domain-containing protein
MGLRTKFNLAVLTAFLVGLALAGVVLQEVFQENARTEVIQNARIMLEAANAIRTYTTKQIQPLIASAHTAEFQPASVPSFAAQTNFRALQAKFADYSYKEAALNPTNPTDRASDWESDLINVFRNRKDQAELVSERDTPTGRVLTLAHPIAIRDPSCLACHSTPANAPASMIAHYGTANGFGWQLNDVVGAQVVSVPMALPLEKAQRTLIVFMAILVGIFLVIVLILNVLLHYVVIKPVVRISKIASAVSLGEMDAEEYVKPGKDEIASLTQSFGRMRRSLERAIKLLEG